MSTAEDATILQARARERWPTIAPTPSLHARFAAGLGSTTHPEELYLACACAEGSRAALEIVERDYLSQIARAVQHVGSEPDFVDEVTQIVRERLFVGNAKHGPKISEYAGKGSLAGWIRVIAVRVALDLRRAAMRMTSTVPDDLISTDAASDAIYLKRRYHAVLQDAINRAIIRLSDEQRLLLRRHFVDGITFEALASATGVHKVTVWRQIAAARDLIVQSMRIAIGVGDKLGSQEFESILRAVQSQLDVSLGIR